MIKSVTRYTFRLLLSVLTVVLFCSQAHAQTYYTGLANDTSNTASSSWPMTTQAGDLIVCYGGTQLTGGQISGTFTADNNGCTQSDGTTLVTCAGCDFTGVSSMETKVWTGTTAGSTTPTFQINTSIPSSTIGGYGIELTGVNTLDQVSTIGFTNQSPNAALTSNTITTTHANEVVLCLGQEANQIAAGNHFTFGAGTGWSNVAFGNQGIAYRIEASTGSFSCTITLGSSGSQEDVAITMISFYQSSAPSVTGIMGGTGKVGGTALVK